jgi:hypothetical protein
VSVTRQKKHIVTKDVFGLLLGEVVSTKKTHRLKGCGWLDTRRCIKKKNLVVAKDVVGLLVGDIRIIV